MEGEIVSRAQLLTRIFQYGRQHVDYRSDQTRAEFAEEYRELAAKLRFPMTVYRGLSLENIDWDAGIYTPEDHPDEYAALQNAAQTQIDWSRIGTSWTWNRESAVAGGKLGQQETHVVIQAQVSFAQVDMLCTLFQNLTVFEEEEEIRLYPNKPIKITGITPSIPLRFPIRANTGPEMWDTRASTLRELGL